MAEEVFSLFALLKIDKSKFDDGLKDAKDGLNKFSSGAKKALSVIGKVSAAALSAAATGVSAMIKQSVAAYGEYEQLVGGVETLFGDSAARVIKDSEEAFKTAGMSMNEYMETSIQSAASLINSLDGDQKKAAELMNMSITDMADNVNRMGTTMEAVQNAYRGFSRGNFTMLDNLALGFSGTKEGMKDLLKKAEEINKKHGNAVKYSIDSYADMVEAIHVVQTEMGITGTTAKEAEKTLQGSLSSMKSAWTNFISGMGNSKANMDELVQNLVTSAKNVLNNLIPIIQSFVKSASSFFKEVAPMLIEELPGMIDEILPGILDAAATVVDAIANALPVLIPKIFTIFIDALPKVIPSLITAAVKLVVALVQNLPLIIKGLIDALPTVIASIIMGLQPLWDGLVEFFNAGWEGIKEVYAPVVEWFTNLFMGARDAIINVWNGIGNFFKGIWDNISTAFANVRDFFTSAFTSAWDGIQMVWNNVTNFFSQIWEGIKNIFGGIADWFGNVFRTAWEAVKNVFSAGGQIFEGIKDGILGALKMVINGIINGINWVIAQPFNGLNWALRGIKSLQIGDWKPFDWIQELPVPQIPLLAQGGVLKRGQIALLEGQGDEAVIPLSQNTEWIDMVAERLNKGNAEQEQGNNVYNFHIEIANMSATSQDDIEALAETLMSIMAEKTNRRGAVFG